MDVPFNFNGISVKNQLFSHFFAKIPSKGVAKMREPNYTDRIRGLREDMDLNQSAVASALHVAQTTYSDYENGKSRIPIETLIELAKFYDVDMNYITAISNVKNKFPK